MSRFGKMLVELVSTLTILTLAFAGFSQEPSRPVVVKFHEPRMDVTEVVLPIDPTPHIQYQHTGHMGMGVTVDGKMLCCGAGAIRTSFRIDNQPMFPANATQAVPLKPTSTGKARMGVESTWIHNNIHVIQTIEIVPSRPTGGAGGNADLKRRLDTVLIRYTIENKDTRPHDVGARIRMDAYCVDNDGPLFASPKTHPGKILNGMELKEKELPEFVQILQRPDLQNPGFVGHFTLKMGNRLEGPNRFFMTAHGAGEDGWNVNLVPAQGDSDCGMFWDPKTIAPGSKRELAYGYGQGIASNPENEGKVTINLTGSFEPAKTFAILAYVEDPMSNQTLTLELPKGIERLEGKEVQPVPQPPPGTGTSLVLWKARVLNLGEFPIRIHSSNGVVQTRTVTISKN